MTSLGDVLNEARPTWSVNRNVQPHHGYWLSDAERFKRMTCGPGRRRMARVGGGESRDEGGRGARLVSQD
jgi:hypothetical protein